MSYSELSTMRRRHADLEDDADARPGVTVNCAPVLAVATYAKSSYPATASAYYACHPIAVSGAESEGSAVVTTTDTAQTVYALNLGSAVPPAGTKLLITMAGGRWEFVYNG